ncbi:hypothetical protein C0991_006887 [Blastosporella zonata]|nr:hypothetical protein C0991_006887 [Blastosporella zonata]
MNGGPNGAERREKRVSVWSALDSLGETSRHNWDVGGDGNDGEEQGGSEEEEDVGEVSGIMMYSPLMPTNLSLVEIAESVILPEEHQEQTIDPASEVAQVAGWMGMWPFSIWGSGAGVVSEGLPPTASPTPSLPASLPASPSGRSARLRGQSKKRVWIPSRTKLSFQAVWWGYRMYLPPPVMDVLGDRTIEAAKRAAMLTVALTWFFSNIPLTALPPALRPALLLMQTLIPYIGYIGSFISWSWGTIQSYDTGHGVILTATWLLPVALIPSTWDANDFPPPSPLPHPASPLPPIGPTSPSSAPQQNPNVPLPTPPPSPPFVLPSQPSTPAHLPARLQSPALSFMTAPTSPLQSPYPYLSPPLPVPSAIPELMYYTNPILSPLHLASPYPSPHTLPHASEPLPPWVLPPPPPSPKTITLPELEEEVGTPRFGLPVLGTRKSAVGGGAREMKEKRKEGERKEGKGKAKLRAILGALGSGRGEGSKRAVERDQR